MLVLFSTMAKVQMTELLRQSVKEALEAGQSLRQIARGSGLQHPPLLRFLRGEQSLRLDKAEMLADYLGIECRRTKQKGKN